MTTTYQLKIKEKDYNGELIGLVNTISSILINHSILKKLDISSLYTSFNHDSLIYLIDSKKQTKDFKEGVTDCLNSFKNLECEVNNVSKNPVQFHNTTFARLI